MSLVQFAKNVLNHTRSTKDVGDVLEQEVAEEPAANHFLRLDAARNGQHFPCIQFHHLTLFIFCNDWEEVEQPADVLLSAGRGASVSSRLYFEVVGKIVEDDQCAGRVEVEHVGILLAVALPVACDVAGVLGTESRLHIERRTFHVAQHEHTAPFRDGHTRRELSHAQSDGSFVVGDGLLHFLVRTERFGFLAEPTVTSSQHHFVIIKARAFLLQQSRQRFGTLHTIQQPERMCQFCSQFFCGVWELLLSR